MNEIELKTFKDNLPEKAITKKQLAKIESRLPELHRAKAIIGHSTSQASYALQTLTMLDDSPMSRMKQCLSNIEHKYQAVREAYFKIENDKLEIKNIMTNKPITESGRLKVRELETGIESTQNSMGNALREIGMFQEMYEAIRKSNNIPEQWSEYDYEKQEIANMVRRSFRLGIQSLTNSGRMSVSAVEFWEQLGIHPQSAEAHCRNYILQIQKMIESGKEPDVRFMYEFLDGMAEKFKDSYKFALDRIGLKELGASEFMAEGHIEGR
jgi:hypothetical protein